MINKSIFIKKHNALVKSVLCFVYCLSIVIWSLCILPTIPASAESLYQASTRVTLKPQNTPVVPGGSFWVALEMDMDQGWHVYWKNPGDSGFAAHVEWALPPGFSAGPINWPYPRAMDEAGLTTYGYSGAVELMMQIFSDESVDPALEHTFSAKVQWLACEKVCVPGTGTLSFTMPTRPADPLLSETQLRKNLMKLPLRQAPWELSLQEGEESFLLSLQSAQAGDAPLADLYFFPDQVKTINHGAKQILEQKPDGYMLEIPKSDLLDDSPDSLSGVIYNAAGWDPAGLRKAWAVHLPIETMGAVLPEDVLGIVPALLFAFLGGLILNLMPCVLPVLSLKVLNFVQQAKESRARVMQHGVMFTLGIVSAFWVLALVMIALRAAGAYVGWGFQFQSPIFLGIMAAIFLWLALSMFGFYEIGGGLTRVKTDARHSGTLRGSFFNGILATIVATPCTAPFMGSALGYAVLQPTVVTLLIFTFLGLGMASPYVVLSLFPAALKFVPKPGPWMLRFKQVLGVLLLATSIWLLTVLMAQLGVSAGAKNYSSQQDHIQWQKFSSQRVEQLREGGQAVFVDFTAKWCLTCQVNKKTTLNKKQVADVFKRNNVVALRADWTNHDEAITRALAAFGKTSIPVYVLYPADLTKDPVLLPEILTPGIVIERVEEVLD